MPRGGLPRGRGGGAGCQRSQTAARRRVGSRGAASLDLIYTRCTHTCYMNRYIYIYNVYGVYIVCNTLYTHHTTICIYLYVLDIDLASTIWDLRRQASVAKRLSSEEAAEAATARKASQEAMRLKQLASGSEMPRVAVGHAYLRWYISMKELIDMYNGM